MKKTLLSAFFLFTALYAFSYAPSYRYAITVNNTGLPETNYKLSVNFSAATFVSSGDLQPNFQDVRFSTQATCPTTFLSHYIESVNSGNGKMWVNIPSFPTGVSTFYMYFGDHTVASTSNFAATFPSAYIAPAGNTAITGTQNFDWFEVPVGSTLLVTQGAPLTVNASRIKISGTINANGKGFAAGTTFSSIGAGPGGGSNSVPNNAGAGGGGYGGNGGNGGMDAGDTPGAGGAANGSASGSDASMGSAGGSSLNTLGGNGGGMVVLDAKVEVTVNGSILANGNSGTLPGASFGGGGGSGGCISINGDIIILDGAILSATGGAGSTGVAAGNDSGGGGGGGRIKVRYGKAVSTTGISTNVSGGLGGPNGSFLPGQNGSVGTYANLTVPAKVPYTQTTTISTIICFPLPVELVYFNAKAVNETSLLTWKTSYEKDNLQFDVEHSTDGIIFKKIGTVTATNSLEGSEYSYTHNTPVGGTNYYRLKQLDISLHSTYSNIQTVLHGQYGDVICFPNPASNEITIALPSYSKPVLMELYNSLGQIKASNMLKSANTVLDISHLPQGVYVLRVGQVSMRVIKK